LVGALVAFMLVKPIVGCREAHSALAQGQQMRPLLLLAADAIPAAAQKEDSAPGVEAVGDKRSIVAEEIAPAETRPLKEIDLRHHEVAKRGCFAAFRALPEMTAQRAFGGGERHDSAAVGAILGR